MAEQRGRHLLGRKHEVGQVCGDRTARHPVEAGRDRLLHDDHAARLLDGADAAGAVAAGPASAKAANSISKTINLPNQATVQDVARAVDDLLASPVAEPHPHVGRVLALIEPHAGYVYSGAVAASAYARLAACRDRIERVVLLGGGEVVVDGPVRTLPTHTFFYGMEPGEEGFEERRQFLLDVYKDNLCRHTTLFDGIAELLDDLDRRAIPWGIVTNKPAWLTDPLMQAMRFNERTRCIVSGDTCQYSKPHPQPMLHAACLIEAAPEHCLYLGDARRDIQAGKAAGMMTAAAAYGYIEPHDPAENWDADWLIAHPLELLPLLQPAA